MNNDFNLTDKQFDDLKKGVKEISDSKFRQDAEKNFAKRNYWFFTWKDWHWKEID